MLFLCATGTALSLPKGNGCSWVEKVQCRPAGSPGHLGGARRSHTPIQDVNGFQGAAPPAPKRVCARRVWRGRARVGVNGLLPFPRAPPVAQGGAASGMKAIRASLAGGRSLNPIRASQPWKGARRGAQAPRGGRVRSPGVRGAPRAALSTAPAARRIPSLRARPRRAPPFPTAHLRASNPRGHPDPSRSRLGTPDLRRSPSSRLPDFLSRSTATARTRVGRERDQLAPSLQSLTPAILRLEIEWEGPQAAGARSTPGIDSQVFSLVARDPLAALCGIFPRDPLPSLGRQIPRLPNPDPPSTQTQSQGRSTGSPPLPGPTLPTFLPGPQPRRNLAAIAHRSLPSPSASGGLRADSPPPPPAAAAQPTLQPPPPARAAPPPARSPRHLPAPPRPRAA